MAADTTSVHGQASVGTGWPLALRVTSTLPRVALEYGQTWWAAATIEMARSGSSIPGRVTSSPTATLNPRFSLVIRLTSDSMETVPEIRSLSPSDHAECSFEARRVANGEQLLGIRAASLATHFNGCAELHVQRAVAGHAVPLLSATRHVGSCRVERFGHFRLLSSLPLPTLPSTAF